MGTDAPATLSELSERPATRREFLIKSSVLGALAPFVMTACDIDRPAQQTGASSGSSAGAPPQAGPGTAVRNPDSKLDTGGHANIHQSTAALPIRISDDTIISAWTFSGDIPGPIVHVRQGDSEY